MKRNGERYLRLNSKVLLRKYKQNATTESLLSNQRWNFEDIAPWVGSRNLNIDIPGRILFLLDQDRTIVFTKLASSTLNWLNWLVESAHCTDKYKYLSIHKQKKWKLNWKRPDIKKTNVGEKNRLSTGRQVLPKLEGLFLLGSRGCPFPTGPSISRSFLLFRVPTWTIPFRLTPRATHHRSKVMNLSY